MIHARWKITDAAGFKAKMELWTEEDRKIMRAIVLAGAPEGSLMVFDEAEA